MSMYLVPHWTGFKSQLPHGLCIRMLFFFNSHPRIYLLILEREAGRQTDRHTHTHTDINVREKHWSVASRKYPKWGLNPLPFGVQDSAPTYWATWPGSECCCFYQELNSARSRLWVWGRWLSKGFLPGFRSCSWTLNQLRQQLSSPQPRCSQCGQSWSGWPSAAFLLVLNVMWMGPVFVVGSYPP